MTDSLGNTYPKHAAAFLSCFLFILVVATAASAACRREWKGSIYRRLGEHTQERVQGHPIHVITPSLSLS